MNFLIFPDSGMHAHLSAETCRWCTFQLSTSPLSAPPLCTLTSIWRLLDWCWWWGTDMHSPYPQGVSIQMGNRDTCAGKAFGWTLGFRSKRCNVIVFRGLVAGGITWLWLSYLKMYLFWKAVIDHRTEGWGLEDQGQKTDEHPGNSGVLDHPGPGDIRSGFKVPR